MEAEIAETPQAVARLLDQEASNIARLGRLIAVRAPGVIVTCARGSSDHAAGYFKYLTEILLGVPVASIGPSIASVYGASLRLRDAVLISVSQSGQSPDVLALQAAARAGGALAIAVVNQAESPLAVAADAVVPLHAGPERSVAATKTCIASMVALVALVAEWRGDQSLRTAIRRLPDALGGALRTDWSRAMPAFTAAQSAYVVGRGPGLPVASEAALKLKETAVVHAEAFSGAEVMHGPLQLLRPGFPVIAFAQADASRAAMRGSVDRLRAASGRVFVVSGDNPDEIDHLGSPATGSAILDPVAMLLCFYSFAERLARARGYDPDAPSHLRKVTETI